MKEKASCIFVFFVFFCSISCASESEWISLFDGESFDGWRADENPSSWVVEEGAFVSRGERSHLFYVGDVSRHDFKNFEFCAKVKTSPGSNSGIYVHTKFQSVGWPAVGYECQVLNSNPSVDNGYVERKMTASIYAVRNTWKSLVADGEWFEYRIVVSGKTIQTYINGTMVSEYTESEDAWRSEGSEARVLDSGTFALQGHDPSSVVHYREMKVRLLPDDAPSLGVPEADAELDRLLTKLSGENMPLIDVGIYTDSPNFQARLDLAARRYGLSFGSDYGIRSAPRDAMLRVIVETEFDPIVAALKVAKSEGKKVVFDSQGVRLVDVAALKVRLQAIEASGLEWGDFWVPGK